MSNFLLLGTGGGGGGGNPFSDPDCTVIWREEDAVADIDGVNLLVDSKNSFDLVQLTGSMKPDVVTGGIQGDAVDDSLGAVPLSNLVSADEYLMMLVFQVPSSLSAFFGGLTGNPTESSGPMSAATVWGFKLGSDGGLFYLSAFHKDVVGFKQTAVQVLLSTSYVASLSFSAGTLKLQLDTGVSSSIAAGDLVADAQTFAMHTNGSRFDASIINYTTFFNAAKTPAQILGFEAFLLPRKP